MAKRDGKELEAEELASFAYHIPTHMRVEKGKDDAPAVIDNPAKRGWFGLLLRFGFFLGLSGAILGGVAGLTMFARYAKGIPVFRSLSEYKPPLPSTFYSKSEEKIAELAAQKRVLVPYSKIPKKLVYAFVAAEDDRFFQHGGVDPLGIMRAVVKNLKKGKLTSGGSTLTQQVAKTFLFDRLVIHLKKNICRNDRQCGWRERCKSRPGAAFGRCTPRSFRSCVQRVTVISSRGRPATAHRGYSTLCDPHEVCRAKCNSSKAIMAGMCRRWTCVPSAIKPLCSSSQECKHGQRCSDGECKPGFVHQVTDLIRYLEDKGVVVARVKGPSKFLQQLEGSFKRTKSRGIMISAREAGHIKLQKLEKLPGIKIIYRFAEKSLRRKVREAILATRFEKQFTKEQILWLYLNQIPLGHRSHGVQAAAQNYFGKNVWDLRLEEAAILAGIPKAPTRYDPYRHPKRALTRMRYVLKRMLAMKYISQEEHDEALVRSQSLKTKSIPNLLRTKTPYFTEEVRKKVQRKYGKERLMRDGLQIYTTVNVEKQYHARNALRSGLRGLDQRQGYRGPLGVIAPENWAEVLKKATKYYGDRPIVPGRFYAGLVTKVNHKRQRITVRVGKHTGTLPLRYMRWARKPSDRPTKHRNPVIGRIGKRIKAGYWIFVEPVKSSKTKGKGLVFRLRQYPKVEGAIISLDPHTGYIDALVGGFEFIKSPFNRAMYACRQPGSSFKPVIYSTGLDAGEKKGRRRRKALTLGSILLDTPIVHDSKDPGASRYKPKNSNGRYLGEVMIYRALVYSMNIPSMKLMMRVGTDKIIEYARKFGFTTQLKKEMGLAIGQSCVRPWELTQFYAMVARGGLKSKPILIKMVLDRKGEILEDNRIFSDPTLSPESKLNRLEANLFDKEERVLKRSSAYLITYAMRDVVKKTTGKVVRRLGKPAAGKTGTTNDSFDVWFAGITPKHATVVWMGFDKNERPLGNKEDGGRTAAPVWLDFMVKATRGEHWGEWRPAGDIVWAIIDPRTGRLAHPGTPGAKKLPFRRGTAPRQMSDKVGAVKAEDFYRNY